MEKGISFRKELGIATVIFLLPLASYLHLFFIDYPSSSLLGKFSNKIFNYELAQVLYYLLFLASFSLLYLLWWRLVNKPYKWFILLYIGVLFYQFDGQFDMTELSSNAFLVFFIFYFLLAYIITNTNLYLALKTSKSIKISFRNLAFSFLFLVTSLLCFLFKFYPNNTDSLWFLFFELEANGFRDASTNLYVISLKFSLVSGILIWYFTEKRWYRYALLSSIIILSNQLYNLLWTNSDFIDEFELRESGVFLFSVMLGLILISHAAHNQAKISSFIFNRYMDIEKSVTNRFKNRENYIVAKREEFNTSKTNLDELKKIREQLEQVVRGGSIK